jgi:hypothetical protein
VDEKFSSFCTVRKYIKDKCILHLFKIAVLYKVCDIDHEAGLSIVSWYLLVVHDREVDVCPFC